jgi:hypothetical protein
MNIDLNKIFESKKFRVALMIIGGLVVLLVVFQAGMTVGFRKAGFSYRWAENYHQNFAGPREGFFGNFMRDMMSKDFINGHGVFGQIIKIDGSTLAIKGADNAEKTILLKDDTAIERFRETIKPADLKAGDQIVIIGEPNDSGQIEAKLIRVMPTGQFPSAMPMMRPH